MLATKACQTRRVKSQRKASALYNVARTTLRDRLTGSQPRAVAHLHQRKLQQTEEQSLIE
jgi:uncharacterized protein (DUF2267 family)